MGKTIKLTIKCPKCASLSALPIVEEEVGTKKRGVCPKCGNIFSLSLPTSLASKFVSNPTMIGSSGDNRSLLLEVMTNNETSFQSFELTADYYTIGRKNNSGPASRPDIEIITSDMTMSRKHAVIKKKGKIGFTLMDLNSKNGIKINGEQISADEEIYLTDGDVFLLGKTQVRVSISENSAEYEELTRLSN